MTTTEPHPALAHWCPFCGAPPRYPCVSRTSGATLDRPHSRRIHAGHPRPEIEREQALCCQCGQLRTVSANYSRRYNTDPNNTYGDFDDKRGWRQTRTLNCKACGEPTRHALVFRDTTDWDEKRQRFILGGEAESKYWDDAYRERLRSGYFAQFPRNPKLTHRYWVREAKDAFAAGKMIITSLCGAPMTLDFDPNKPSTSPPSNELIAPDRIDWETEFEDHDTGMWWVDMDCVDCLAVSNTLKLKSRRREVLSKLLEVSAVVENLGAQYLLELDEHLQRLIGGTK